MTAIRTARSAEGRFVMVANGAAQDRRLTAAARGILLFALSLPPDAHFTAKWLEGQLPDGREKIRSALRNLEQCGYLRRTKTAAGKGIWKWEQVISDAPLDLATPEFSQVATCDGFPSDELTCDDAAEPEFPQVPTCDGNPSDGNPSDKRLKTGSSKTSKDLKNESQDHQDKPATSDVAPPPAAYQKSRPLEAPRPPRPLDVDALLEGLDL